MTITKTEYYCDNCGEKIHGEVQEPTVILQAKLTSTGSGLLGLRSPDAAFSIRVALWMHGEPKSTDLCRSCTIRLLTIATGLVRDGKRRLGADDPAPPEREA